MDSCPAAQSRALYSSTQMKNVNFVVMHGSCTRSRGFSQKRSCRVSFCKRELEEIVKDAALPISLANAKQALKQPNDAKTTTSTTKETMILQEHQSVTFFFVFFFFFCSNASRVHVVTRRQK
jgi:hypothetical protein